VSLLSDLVNALFTLLFSALSAMGVGGGSALMLYLTELRGMDSAEARTVNLICFLVCALAALPFYRRQGLLGEGRLMGALLLPGMAMTLLGASIAAALPSALIRKLFGAFLILTSLHSLLGRAKRKKNKKPSPRA